jgi:hypothetical protein
MKTPIQILASILILISFPPGALAQARKKEPATPVGEGKPAEAAKPTTKAVKPLPMNARVDEIDATAKTFTQFRRDGVKVKHVVTENTQILQGEVAVNFEDIKVGDMVAGSRRKKNADGTEYEIVKITKFGPKPKAEEPRKKAN